VGAETIGQSRDGAAGFRGCWRREWIAWPGQARDAATAVTWLQAGRLYCDLRQPAARPDFSGRTSLADCAPDELRWLARQEGFAGHLEVAGDLCIWHRHLDFQWPTGIPDVGRMEAQANGYIETGVFAPYTESWRAESSPGPVSGSFAAKLSVRDTTPGLRPWRQGILIVVGAVFMFALERALTPARQQALAAQPIAELDDAALREALDCEISFGIHASDAPWQVQRSTLPFLEGRPLFSREAPACTTMGLPRPDRASLRLSFCHWIVDEAQGTCAAGA
jgi:hypothetical protein